MANHKSALKRARQSEQIRARRHSAVSDLRTHIKKVREVAAKKDVDGAKAALAVAVQKIDKAASKGLIHPRNASRRVARLSKLVGSLAAG